MHSSASCSWNEILAKVGAMVSVLLRILSCFLDLKLMFVDPNTKPEDSLLPDFLNILHDSQSPLILLKL